MSYLHEIQLGYRMMRLPTSKRVHGMQLQSESLFLEMANMLPTSEAAL